MDIKGAKALKERLARNGAADALPVPEDVDVPEDAAPVFHWTGKVPAKSAIPEVGDDSPLSGASLFSRLSLSFH